MGERAMQTAEALLNSNLVHFFGSDTHGPKTRTPRLRQAKDKSTSLIGEKITRRILVDNPSAIISSEDIIIADVQKIITVKKPGLWKRIAGILG